ncbi:MAG: imidazolonepropionase [Candidatus Limnocylindria bacterium]
MPDQPTEPFLLTGSGRLAPLGLSPWAVLVVGGRIAWVGGPHDAPRHAEQVDLGSALVTPGLVDSHTHPVFAGDRADEAAARLEGAPYSGGGILRTVAATREADDATLERLVEERLGAALAAGTTTVECKSGYGLSRDEELRHLRVIGRVARRMPVRVIRTLLAAHAVPPEAAAMSDYAAHDAHEIVPAAAAQKLAEFVDIFCDEGFFDAAATERIGLAARSAGLGLRLHADQFVDTNAAALGVRLGAASVDHLEQLGAAGINALAESSTVATLLPAPALVLRSRMPPARALIDAGTTVALASDANAGTFRQFGAMPLVVGLGATLLGMTVSEALTAATAGSAAALGLWNETGAIREAMAADLVAWDAEHEGAFALGLGSVRPHRAWIEGREVPLSG